MTVTIITGDCREKLRELPDESVHCCVSSPPYFGLRDYGHDAQMGLEATPDEYVAGMVALFAEVRRVLRDDGTLWLNIGDSYGRNPAKGGSGPNGKHDSIPDYGRAREIIAEVSRVGSSDGAVGRAERPGTRAGSVKEKDLIGIPWLLAFALRADGWYLRQDIIWSKPNPMPESVRDRCTKAHEQIFLLAKSPRYFYDADAIAEETVYQPLGVDENSHKGSSFTKGKTADHQLGRASDKPRRSSRAKGDFSDDRKRNGDDGMAASFRAVRETRNKRSVWTVATQPFSEAHFATFPPELIQPCILAGCPVGGTVLDPFGGAGTTGLVADRLQRNAVLIEINPEYAAMARRRIDGDRGGLLDAMEAA